MSQLQETFKINLASRSDANAEILGPAGQYCKCHCCTSRGGRLSTKIVAEGEKLTKKSAKKSGKAKGKDLKVYKYVDFANNDAVRNAAVTSACDIPICSRHLISSNLRAFLQNDFVYWENYWADLDLMKSLLRQLQKIAADENLMEMFNITREII